MSPSTNRSLGIELQVDLDIDSVEELLVLSVSEVGAECWDIVSDQNLLVHLAQLQF